MLSNPLPVPVTVDFDCTIKGYWGQVAGEDAQKITLQPHERLTPQNPLHAHRRRHRLLHQGHRFRQATAAALKTASVGPN